jgi:hypothetical protein
VRPPLIAVGSPADRVELTRAYRSLREEFAGNDSIAAINAKLKASPGDVSDRDLSLGIDISQRASWESSLVPHLNDLPFTFVGKGEQSSLKILLALNRKVDAAHIILVEEPARQVFPDLTGLVQVTQEIGQARAQRAVGLRRIAPVLAPGPASGQVPGLRPAGGFQAGLLQVGQERIRGTLLRHDAGLGVTPGPARSQIFVPHRTETWRAPVGQRRGGLAHPGHAPVSALHQQHQGPACELGLPGTRRLTQARQPAPRPLGHKIEAVRLGREVLRAGLQEPGERVQLRLVALDRSTRSACRTQRGDHPS